MPSFLKGYMPPPPFRFRLLGYHEGDLMQDHARPNKQNLG